MTLLALGGVFSGTAVAGTYFADDFEAPVLTSPGQTMRDPRVGMPYFYNPQTQGQAVNVVASPKPLIESARRATLIWEACL